MFILLTHEIFLEKSNFVETPTSSIWKMVPLNLIGQTPVYRQGSYDLQIHDNPLTISINLNPCVNRVNTVLLYSLAE